MKDLLRDREAAALYEGNAAGGPGGGETVQATHVHRVRGGQRLVRVRDVVGEHPQRRALQDGSAHPVAGQAREGGQRKEGRRRGVENEREGNGCKSTRPSVLCKEGGQRGGTFSIDESLCIDKNEPLHQLGTDFCREVDGDRAAETRADERHRASDHLVDEALQVVQLSFRRKVLHISNIRESPTQDVGHVHVVTLRKEFGHAAKLEKRGIKSMQ